MNKVFEHFKLICNHKRYVFEACRKAGIPMRGLRHDLSKFSPTEFFESVKYFSGDRSPIDNCKDINGYSLAWFHHRGRNKHHWEYWVDNFEKGMNPVQMPFEYALEMLCDFIGAGKAYKKDKFTYDSEWEWWLWKRERVVMHPVVWHFINFCLKDFKESGEIRFNYYNCKAVYDNYNELFKEGKLNGEYNSKIK